jgi:hypothetical protein
VDIVAWTESIMLKMISLLILHFLAGILC